MFLGGLLIKLWILKMEEDLEKENCVCCDEQTQVKKNENVNNRNFYIEGVGQLCSECFFNVHKNFAS